MSVVSIIEPTAQRWRRFCDQLLDLLLPPRCIYCHRIGAWLCTECLSRVPRVEPPFCIRCGDKVETGDLCGRCQTSPLRIECIRSVAYFEGALREAVHHLKYRGRTVLAEPLGNLMATCWAQHAMPADVVVPVPLHASRLRSRGYNQAALLAREMTRQVGLPLDERTLVRQRATAPQVELEAAQRRKNVHGAFYCTSDALVGKQALLIDDVCTTGATLEACAVALYAEGTRGVRALTLARAH